MKSAGTIVVAALLIAVAIVASSLSAAEIPQGQRRSGFSFMSPDTKAMATGHAMQDTAAVCAVLEKMAGVKRTKARKKR